MPYITPEERRLIGYGAKPANAGQLNYTITTLIVQYLGDSPRYQQYNDVMGVLSCIQHELYRKRIASYENKKCKENGDVY